MTVEINLTDRGEKQVDNLLRFEDTSVSLSYYRSPPRLDVSGLVWTLGNDCLLILAGERDDVQTFSPSLDPEQAFDAFAERVTNFFHGSGMDVPTHAENESPRYDLRIVWEDFLAKGLVTLEEVDEDAMCQVPEL